MYVGESRASTPVRTAPIARGLLPGRSAGVVGAVSGTVLALGAVSLITDISSEMVTAVLPLYLVTGLGLSPLGFGLLDGVYNGFSALVRLVGGHLADRGAGRGGRHKPVAAFGYGLSALCKPLLLLVHTLPLIGAALALDRTGKGLRTAPRDALISLSSAPETRGRSFGVHRAMDTTGALLGPLAAFLILRQAADGYDAVFSVSFCVAALGVIVLLLFVPARIPVTGRTATGPTATGPTATGPTATAKAVPASERPSLRAALGLLGRRELRALTLCAVALGLATVSDSFVYLMLQRRLGVPDRWFALLPLGTAGAFLLLAVPLGRWADRIGRRRVFIGGHLALLCAYGLLLSHLRAGFLPYAVLALHGAFYAATDGVLMAAAAGRVPEALRSSGLALVQTGQAAARFCCSLAFGAAWTAWGDRSALAGATVALAVSVAVSIRLRPVAGDE